MRVLFGVALLLAGCHYQGPPQTAIEAAHVQWSREGQPEAFRCHAQARRTGKDTFDVSCGATLKTHVWCTSSRTSSCCIVVIGKSIWQQASGDAPRVCAERYY
jgi:hypothetical protein